MLAEELAGRFRAPERRRDGWWVFCSVHTDGQKAGRRSLRIAEGQRGPLVKCWAGCDNDAILQAVGLTWHDVLGDRPRQGRRRAAGDVERIVATYDYEDEGGALLRQAVRFAPKDFRQRKPDGAGGWTWNVAGVRQVVYRLSEIAALRPPRIWVVEGEKDADALWAIGLPATTNVGGAGKWRGEGVAYAAQLHEAGVVDAVLIPDADVPGWRHMVDVLTSLVAVDLTCHWLGLAGVPEKGDVSDWLAAGGDRVALEALAATTQPIVDARGLPPEVRTALGLPAGAPTSAAEDYHEESGQLCYRQVGRDGDVTWAPLCNFTARVTEELLVDDGVEEPQRRFTILGTLDNGTPLRPVQIWAREFSSLGWVTTAWGAGAIVRAGTAPRDHVRAGILALSTPITRHIYAHTGYVAAADGTGVYLSSSGAVGVDSYEVDLGGDTNLRRYALPCHPNGPREAMETSLALRDVAPLDVMLPLLAAVWRAPLASRIPCDFSLWLVGETGARKSSLAALVLCHYGDFPTKTALPLHWSWTVAALEASAFRLKDALTIIDDYAPDKADPREIVGKAQRIIRALGNVAGRGRLSRDLSERPPRPPRGLVVSTGEAFPPGESIAARTLILRLQSEQVDLAQLSAAQQPDTRARLTHALAGYVGWLGQRFTDGFDERLTSKLGELRRRAQRASQHPRVPEIVASLQLGWIYGLRYAVETGALSHDEAEVRRHQAWDTLLRVGEAQGALVEARQPVRVFLEIMSALLEQQRVVLLPHDVKPEETQLPPGREILGWHDAHTLYLIPKVTFREVGRYCRDVGESFPVPEDQIVRLLAEGGIAETGSGSADGRTRAYCGGVQRRVIKLDRDAIVALIGPLEIPELPQHTQQRGRGTGYKEPGDDAPF